MLIHEALDRTLLTLEERKAGVPPLKTGFGSLDKLKLGLLPGAVVSVECADEEARLDFLLAIAANAASADRAVMVTTRRSTERLSQRLLSSLSGVKLARFASGPLGKADEQALTAAAARLWDRPLVLESENPGPYLGELICDVAEQLPSKSSFDLVIVDNASTRFEALCEAAVDHRVVILAGSGKVRRIGGSTLRLDVLRARHSAIHVAACQGGFCQGEATLSWDPECAQVVDDEYTCDEVEAEGSARWWREEPGQVQVY